MKTTYWIHNLDPVALHIWGNFGIRYYGLAYLLAFGIGYYFLTYLRRKGKSPLNSDQESTALTALLLGVIAGGRLGYIILYDFSQALHNP
ncbi:prolipoprotein diacylglyceryl transferase, partial [bacterium]|nr:prolipoprotein diacylglyceryl transferase [bacterium]